MTDAGVRPWWRPVWRVRQPMSWLLVPLTIAGVVAIVAYRAESAAGQPLAALVSVASQALVAVLMLWILRRIDVLGRPWAVVAVAFAWGGGISVFLAGPLNDEVGAITGKLGLTSVVLSAPIIEEALKLIGIIAVIGVSRAWVRDPLDGLAVGAAVGIGFSVVENVTYGIDEAWAHSGPGEDPLGRVLIELAGRVVIGFGSHALFAGIVGYGFALLLLSAGRGRTGLGVLGFVSAVVGVVVAHAVWDSDYGLEGDLDLVPPFLVWLCLVGVLLLLVRRARRRLGVRGRRSRGGRPAAVEGELGGSPADPVGADVDARAEALGERPDDREA